MIFFKRKTFWLIIFLTILGTALRLIFINKPDGLWNDEYLSWMIASIPFGKSFANAVIAQCHMPFYYLYLKFFMMIFKDSDLALRLTSVLPGVLAIPTMYYLGKEFKDEKLGVLCAAFASLSSFLIYFSQEVRFYELLFLFSCLGLIFTLKLIKKQNSKNIILYIVFNLLIILTHTIGFIYVLFNFLALSIYLSKNKDYKKILLSVWILTISVILIAIPFGLNFANSHPLSQWWDNFSAAKIGFLITDYFSPILTNIVSSPTNFFYDFSLKFIIFALIPSLIALFGIFNAIFNKEENKITLSLFLITFAYVCILVIFALTGKLLFITKYSIEIYPTLILLSAYGILKFEKNWRIGLIFTFCFLNLFYILVSTKSAPKLHRSEGHKIVADLLTKADLNKGDLIILNYYPKDRFEKYFNFDNYRVISVNKGNYTDYSAQNFDEKFNNEVLKQLKPHQKVVLVVLNDVAMYSPSQLAQLFQYPEQAKKIPQLFLVFSQIRNDFFESGLKNLQISRIEKKGSWSVATFIKPARK